MAHDNSVILFFKLGCVLSMGVIMSDVVLCMNCATQPSLGSIYHIRTSSTVPRRWRLQRGTLTSWREHDLRSQTRHHWHVTAIIKQCGSLRQIAFSKKKNGVEQVLCKGQASWVQSHWGWCSGVLGKGSAPQSVPQVLICMALKKKGQPSLWQRVQFKRVVLFLNSFS